MSTTVKIAAVVTAAMAIVVALLAAAVLVRVGDDGDDTQRTIRTTGSGFVLVAPDHATVTAAAEGRSADSREALQSANARMERVLDAAREAGIDEEQLSTTGVQTRRERERFGPEPSTEPGDWVATITLRIEIDDLDLVGEVLAAVNDAGAQQVTGPDYSVRDREAAYADALAIAMDDARGKADAIAERADVGVGELVSADEAGGGDPRPFATATALDASAAGGESIAVTPGETERITATVTTTWSHD